MEWTRGAVRGGAKPEGWRGQLTGLLGGQHSRCQHIGVCPSRLSIAVMHVCVCVYMRLDIIILTKMGPCS